MICSCSRTSVAFPQPQTHLNSLDIHRFSSRLECGAELFRMARGQCSPYGMAIHTIHYSQRSCIVIAIEKPCDLGDTGCWIISILDSEQRQSELKAFLLASFLDKPPNYGRIEHYPPVVDDLKGLYLTILPVLASYPPQSCLFRKSELFRGGFVLRLQCCGFRSCSSDGVFAYT